MEPTAGLSECRLTANVRGHRPAGLGEKVDRRLALVFANPDPAKGLEAAKAWAAEQKADHPDAAPTLLEGMFALRCLGVSRKLAEMPSCTNAIESMIFVARTVVSNVKK